MKKQIFAVAVLCATAFVSMADSNDPVLMNVAGKDIRLSEFEYLYQKNNTQQVQPQTLDEYVDMFVNYKLKVADAEAAGIDTTQAFVDEYIKFRNELAEPYLRDEKVLDSVLHENYEMKSTEVSVSHIMMRHGAEKLLDSLRTEIVEGRRTFEDVAREYSIDKPSAVRGGMMGIVFEGYPLPFREASYATAVGEISPVTDSGMGIHLIRVETRRPNRGEVLAAHILRLTRGLSEEAAAQEKNRIDSIYNVAIAEGSDFSKLARQYSQDPGSAQQGGKLDWFGSGMMVHEFDSVAFALPNGTISKPFRTAYGWHIIHKIDSRSIGTFEEMRESLEKSIPNNERGNLPRQEYVRQMIKKYDAKLLMDNIDKIETIAEEQGAKLDSAMLANFAQSTLPLMVVDGKEYTLGNVTPTLPVSATAGGKNIKVFIQNWAHTYMCNRVLDCAREDLVDTEPDYRNLVNEYRDGILLFEISNRNVWDRAAKDKAGLDAYFEANRDKYTWDSPKFKSYVIFTPNDSLLNEAIDYAATIPTTLAPTDFVQIMRTRFGRNVKVERVIAAKGENAITDFLAFGGEKPESENSRWKCYAAFNGRILDAPEDAADVRGTVVSDYQSELERQWVAALHDKYKVKINKDVLNKVK